MLVQMDLYGHLIGKTILAEQEFERLRQAFYDFLHPTDRKKGPTQRLFELYARLVGEGWCVGTPAGVTTVGTCGFLTPCSIPQETDAPVSQDPLGFTLTWAGRIRMLRALR